MTLHPWGDKPRKPPPIGSTATTGSHIALPLARTLLKTESTMRTTIALAFVSTLAAGAAGCLGEVGGPRKPPGQGSGSNEPVMPSTDGPCEKVEKNVTIRVASDIDLLPKDGCYDIVGTLTIQSPAITSLAKLGGLNSVTDLDLDHTALTKIDSGRAIGVYGRLTVTGNPVLTTLANVVFKTASPGVLIDGNPLLVTAEPFALDTAQLTEIDGDLTITGNPLLLSLNFRHLAKVSGKLLIAGNNALTSIDFSKLASTGGLELADNPRLASVTGLAATEIAGDFALRNNAALTGMGMFNGLARITGDVTIDGNAALTSLAAFTTALKNIDNALTISNNAALTDVGALKHLDHIRAITIVNNRQLVKCRAWEVDRCVAHDQGSNINNNRDTSCNTSCN